jgi:hypothetical protein
MHATSSQTIILRIPRKVILQSHVFPASRLIESYSLVSFARMISHTFFLFEIHCQVSCLSTSCLTMRIIQLHLSQTQGRILLSPVFGYCHLRLGQCHVDDQG